MFNITGIQGLDTFIMQSMENRQIVIDELCHSTELYIDNILLKHRLTRADFTDSDWNIIKQYLYKGE